MARHRCGRAASANAAAQSSRGHLAQEPRQLPHSRVHLRCRFGTPKTNGEPEARAAAEDTVARILRNVVDLGLGKCVPGVDEEPRRVAKHGLASLSEAAIEWLHDHQVSLQVLLGYKVLASELRGISHAFTSLASAEADGSSKAEKRKSQDMGEGMEETERQTRATPANASVSRMQSKMGAVGSDVVMVPKDVGATTPEPKRARRHSRQTIETSTVLQPPLADKDAFKVQCAEWLRTTSVRTVFVKTSYEDHKWTRVVACRESESCPVQWRLVYYLCPAETFLDRAFVSNWLRQMRLKKKQRDVVAEVEHVETSQRTAEEWVQGVPPVDKSMLYVLSPFTITNSEVCILCASAGMLQGTISKYSESRVHLAADGKYKVLNRGWTIMTVGFLCKDIPHNTDLCHGGVCRKGRVQGRATTRPASFPCSKLCCRQKPSTT